MSEKVVRFDDELHRRFLKKFSREPEILALIHENAKLRLAALLQLHIASIGRAVTFTGIMVAVTTALIGFLGARVLTTIAGPCGGECDYGEFRQFVLGQPLLVAGLILFGFYVASVFLGALAARPTMLALVGNRPVPVASAYIAHEGPISHAAALSADYANLDNGIVEMEKTVNEENDRLLWAIRLAMWGPVVAAAVFGMLYLL